MFISGIGTDVGKSWTTGWLASLMRKQGINAITQKFIQTGNKNFSEDIAVHRNIMGIEPLPCDKENITAPIILSYPASPHLAEKIDNTEVDYSKVITSALKLRESFDKVIIEGAGGIAVPLRGNFLTIDWIAEHSLPVALVTNGQLGSINHTILSILAIKNKGIDLPLIIYNPFFDKDEIIANDTKTYLHEWIRANSPESEFIIMPDRLI